MDLYTGSITLSSSPRKPIKDIHLSLPTPTSNPPVLASTTQLTYLALVNTSLIPLYLAAGPNFDVWTNDDETVAWFADKLLSSNGHCTVQDGIGEEKRAWWESAGSGQSGVGILVRVDGDKTSEHEGGKEGCQERPRITEILFYASVLSAKSGAEGFPTPPSSSPSGLHTSTPHTENTTTRKTELRIHALPLSSDLLYHSSLTPIHTNDEPLKEDEARFLPPQFPSPPVSEPSPLKKRARVATLFDDATERRKKARRKGGDMVAKTMASVEGSEQAVDVASLSKKISVDQEFADAGSQQKQSHTTHEMSSLISTNEQDPENPKTQKPFPASQRKSTLSRIASTISSQPKPPNPKDPSIETRNKDLLSRIIMAGMRIYGLQQRKRVIKPTPQTEHPTDPESDEYKLIYHQTFKGSCFALRRHISTAMVNQESMRDIVDKLLAIYCNNPLQSPIVQNNSFGQEDDDGGSPFAVRAGRERIGEGGVDECFSTPRVRKEV